MQEQAGAPFLPLNNSKHNANTMIRQTQRPRRLLFTATLLIATTHFQTLVTQRWQPMSLVTFQDVPM